MNDGPLVSIVCLCYNHERFVAEALHSVFEQSYQSIEMIIVDDASNDTSVATIQATVANTDSRYAISTVFLSDNVGNCTAFNRGMALAKGKYMINFATDDVMLPQRIEQQVAYFETLPHDYGVVFTEAQYIDEQGTHLYYHYQDKLKHLYPPPTGDVYAQLLSTYFVAGPTMTVKKEVLDTMHGYDEQLAYEDFDFWYVRRGIIAMPISTNVLRRSANTLLLCRPAGTAPATRSYILRIWYV